MATQTQPSSVNITITNMSQSTEIQDSDECPICINKYTGHLRKSITCPKCDYKCCKSCVQTFLSGLSDDPYCMNCNFGWNK